MVPQITIFGNVPFAQEKIRVFSLKKSLGYIILSIHGSILPKGDMGVPWPFSI